MTRAVFLDRDGVINRARIIDGRPYPPDPVSSYEILPDVPEALQRLKAAGFWTIVVTNQPDVARGTTSRESVEVVHQRLQETLAIDEILACYHDGDACECRKPKPGALLDAARRHAIDLSQSFMVGDRWRDVAAGQRAGCTCFFIDYAYKEQEPEPPFERVTSLAQATDLIVGQGVVAATPMAVSGGS